MQQKSRLESIELFKNMNNDKHCPVCSGEFTDTIPHKVHDSVDFNRSKFDRSQKID